MKFFDGIFSTNAKKDFSSPPSWETIVKNMYDKYLDAFGDEVVEVCLFI